MKTKYALKLLIGMILLQALSSSCDDGDSSKEDKDNSETGAKESISRSDYTGRGTSACQDWQFAHCKYVYETCDFSMQGDMAGCLDQYSSLVCNSDEIASKCAAAFDAGECTEDIFLLCEYMTVTDPAPAIQQCNDYIDAICERSLICGDEPLEDCRAEYAPKVDCDTVIGTHLNYEECMSKIRNLGCMEVFPNECQILFLGP